VRYSRSHVAIERQIGFHVLLATAVHPYTYRRKSIQYP
jgi:hypothetical protein